ncbi:CHC2 zinc finger domain-containing protein [Nonomuraea wenchangensis]|uniref:CHC2 zinc finger domain-containing protein n=1 Tax=Nonomuraea wenchangensis TaxID=568860 RepID=UPI003324F098
MTSINDPLNDRELFLLKAASPILDVVREHVDLQPTEEGGVKGLCPFHEETIPSFHVTPERGTWYCFGCSNGGDVVRFVEKLNNLTYAEAAVFLLRRLSRPTPPQVEQLKKLVGAPLRSV